MLCVFFYFSLYFRVFISFPTAGVTSYTGLSFFFASSRFVLTLFEYDLCGISTHRVHVSLSCSIFFVFSFILSLFLYFSVVVVFSSFFLFLSHDGVSVCVEKLSKDVIIFHALCK